MAVAPSKPKRPDYFFIAVLLLTGLVSGWLLLMPFVPAIARMTMRRFHLSSESFGLWAIQAPIPAMYNFGNQYEVSDLPAGLITPVLDTTRPRYINHFPTRMLTFANTRYNLLCEGRHCYLTIRSAYRGQLLESKIEARPIGEGRYQWIRESSEFIDPAAMDQSKSTDPLGLDQLVLPEVLQ
ncbi:hypothetical protein [Rhodopirellula sp. MGV]|uniref:hypothetical protein n=1 Tax=Rhodopirellula sp. MGV TaxID=2023130 RepID=UPI000B9769AA|nr:hypothetical protein [Rhodopirellula sp. MGV]OYP30348.1 hypothetical protein CGZ80_22975 [Rhodopirellula sp. MGV]PNY34704.1 hypothetical protein C2E31_22325 [Rhodopirellula baltica]